MGEKRFIIAGSFIDGSAAPVRRRVFLEVKEGIITAIGPAAEMPSSEGTVVDDFSHCTIVPALVDTSVYLTRSPSVNLAYQESIEATGSTQRSAMMKQHIGYCHDHGVLGVAENDDITDLLANYRREKKQGMLHIRIPDCRCLDRWGSEAGSPVGRDFLKIHYSGSIEDRIAPHAGLNSEELVRTLRHRGERKAVVVANCPSPVKEALAAGCDAIEQGYGMGEDNLRKMAEKGVLWIPGVLRSKNALDGAGSGGEVGCRFSQRYTAPGKQDPGAEAYWKKTFSEQLSQLRSARRLGVKTVVGTGAGSVGILHGESVVEEMKLFLKAG